MVFPNEPRDARIEIYVNDVWTDITGDVLVRDGIGIQRGRADSASAAQPATCNLTLNNRLGKYSPRNPLGVYVGQLGRNTPIRVRVPTTPGLVLDGTTNSLASTPDAAALDITGDIDLRAEFTIDTDSGTRNLLAKGPLGGPQLSYQLLIGFTAGVPHLTFRWSADGSTTLFVDHDVPEITLEQRIAVRVTLDVDDGLGNRQITFYTAPSIAGPWTLHDPGHGFAGTTSIFSSTSAVQVGRAPGLPDPFIGTIHAVRILNGIGGTEVANPNFDTQTPGAASFADAAGRTWTVGAAAEIGLGQATRVDNELTSLPPRWDISGEDAYVPVEAAGILRRIGQGTQPVNSGLKQFLLSTTPITYWPLDEGPASSRASSAAGTYRATFGGVTKKGVFTFGDGVLADYLPQGLRINDLEPAAGVDFLQGFCLGSDSLPDALCWEFLYRVDPAISGDGSEMSAWTFRATVNGTTVGTFDRWELQFRPDGVNDDIRLVLELDPLGESPTTVNLADSAALAALTDGQLHHVRLHLVEDPVDVDYTVYVDGIAVITGTRTTHTLRSNWDISIFYNRLGATEDLMALGHLIVWENAANIPAIADTAEAAAGFAGEAAGRRFERLCGEVAVPFISIGDLDDTLTMGLQYSDYFSNQLTEIETTDRGLIDEPRDRRAVRYRTRTSLYSQAPAATLDYSAGEVAPPFEPVDDDQLIRNDVFAQRREGSSHQATQETGPLSVLAPPDGVGRYKDEVQVNVQTDAMLPDIASWLRALGTVDEARYPQVTVNLARLGADGKAALVYALLKVDIGDRLVITGADELNIYDDVSLIVQGYSERINVFEHTITFNCTPESPYDIAVYGTAAGAGPDRYDTEGSELAAAVTSTATSLLVRSDETQWTTTPAEFPFDIWCGGERMTVTDIDGGDPVFVGIGTSISGNNATITPGLPAGVTFGDVVLILASIRNSGAGVPDVPANWTGLGGAGTNFRIMGRVYDGVWAMPSITFTGGVANADTIAQSCAFRNVTMVDALTGSALNGSAQDIATGASVTNPDGRPGVHIIQGWKQDDWTSVAALAGYTEIEERTAIAGDDAGQVWDYWINRRGAHTNDPFVVTGGAAAISRFNLTFLPRAPQTVAVTRSVNGVVKSHVAGTAVRLWTTPRYGL